MEKKKKKEGRHRLKYKTCETNQDGADSQWKRKERWSKRQTIPTQKVKTKGKMKKELRR